MKKTLLLLSFVFISLAGFSQTYDNYRYNPLNPTWNDGLLLRNYNTGQIYITFEGKLRYIQTPATLNGLFVNGGQNLYDVPPSVIATWPIGTDVSQDSGFIRDMNSPTQAVYLREGTYLRWIISLPVAQKYTFNLSIAVNKYGLAGYTIGPVIDR